MNYEFAMDDKKQHIKIRKVKSEKQIEFQNTKKCLN